MKKGKFTKQIILIFLALSFAPIFVAHADEDVATTSATTSASTATSTPITNSHNTKEVEDKVRAYFADTPIMIEIARCESKFRQFADSGNVFKGGYGAKMVGIFQINEDAHASKAASLGFDIKTIDGNLGYAKYLYSKEGTNPWISSFPCWNNNTSENTNSSDLSISLTFGMVHPEVLKLQQILNKVGVLIASEGPGSPGQETEKFGFLTRDAVRRFQCQENIVCSGDEYTTSYGVVGSRTRTALLNKVASGEGTDSNSNEQERIKALQAKIEELKKIILDLQKQLAVRNS